VSENNSESRDNPGFVRRNPPEQFELGDVATHQLFHHALGNLATLNELFATFLRGWMAGEKPEPEFVYFVEGTLAQANWNLGYHFLGQRPQVYRDKEGT